MRESQKTTRPPRTASGVKASARARSAARAPDVATVAAAASAGRHAEAIALAGAALASARVAAADRLDLLDLRAESHIATGSLDAASADADAMLEIARRAKKPAMVAQALNRRAYVEIRSGRAHDALTTAQEAMEAAVRSRQPVLEAIALLRLGEAQFRANAYALAARTCTRAARMFKASGHAAWEGRAWWGVSAARSGQGRVEEGDRAANRALALARRAGDLYGVGNAINMLTFHEPDIAKCMRLLKQALAAFEAAGYAERQGVITHNLGNQYSNLGLYRRARRLFLQAGDAYRRAGSVGFGLATTLWMLGNTEHALGNAAAARANFVEAVDRWEASRAEHYAAYRPVVYGQLALWEGDPESAATLYEEGVRMLRDSDQVAFEINALSGLSEAYLAAGRADAALAAAERATSIHRAHDLVDIQSIDMTELWWRYYRALQANGRTAAAQRALALAYRFLVEPISKLTDEGLRRNYLNKVDVHRKIVEATLAGRRRSAGSRRPPAHLAVTSSLQEPFERLVDTGLRMNALRSHDELQEFLIDEATEISGAERVLLILETPAGPRLAGSLVPKGEDASTVMQDVAPALADVARTRIASLAHVPDGAPDLAQRSRIVAPLIARDTLMGYLYADLDGAFGRFHDADRDLLAMLASQAAVALDNAQWSQGLEEKVAQRTEELSASNQLLAQRASELALINSIQQGISASLDFQAIVDLVGDKLREVLHVENIGIRWYDHETRTAHFLYEFEQGERITMPSVRPSVEKWNQVISERDVHFLNTRAQVAAAGVFPGTECALSAMTVRIVSRDRVMGIVIVESFEREYAFGDSEARLLTTIVSSMGVALENARLFGETQRLLKETAQRNAELAVINSVQAALAAELNIQGIYDAVGDKIREIFHEADVGIRILDARAGRLHFPYTYEGGRRIEVESGALQPTGFMAHVLRTRETLVINEDLEQAAVRYGSTPISGTAAEKSAVLVPLVAGDQVRGLLTLVDLEREHAFSDADVRLLETLAGSMSVAFENARLFDETQRLLKETEQRNAELAVISSVQQGVAAVLDFKSIVTVVGEKLREVFKEPDLCIWWWEEGSEHIRRDYSHYRHGVEPPGLLYPLSEAGLATERVLREGAVVVAGNWAEQEAQGIFNIPGTPRSQSVAMVPIVGGQRVLGFVGLEDLDRPHAFDESAVRLLTTVAASMGVALENARLFNETQRHARESSALSDVGRDLSSTLDLATVMDRIATHAKDLLTASDSAIFLPAPDGRNLPRDRRARQIGRRDQGHVDRRGRRHHREAAAERAAGTHQRHAGRRARRADSRHRGRSATSG